MFKFGQQPTNIIDPNTEWPDTPLSHFSGADESKCPAGKKTGPYQPVYQTNPGGNSFVIVPGAAAPVKTPLIGPPRTF